MKYCLLLFILLPGSLWAQCANTAYGSFTCVQSLTPVTGSATVASNTLPASFTATATAGNGVMIFGAFCTANPCNSTTSPPASITVTDDVGDMGFQPCANNGSSGNGVRYWYCWWLPSVGAAKTFTLHANAVYSPILWIAEIAGGCNTNACIGVDVPSILCMGPCGAQITTNFTNVLVIGYGYSAGVLLTPAAGWRALASGIPGNIVAAFQAVPGPYTPSWTNAVMLQAMAVSIKSRSNSATTQITVPAMPVF